MKNLLVTGGAGFIGSNFIRHVLESETDRAVVNLDKLTYAGNPANLKDVEDRYGKDRYFFVKADICDPVLVERLFKEKSISAVVNFAAQSHVDRSIEDPAEFVKTNVTGTQVLLETARRHKAELFVQISTDEVYGSLGEEGKFTEDTPLAPNSPYSASKAGADMICRGYYKTFGFPVIVTRCSNNYGPYQFPEKLIPLVILRASRDKDIPVYGRGENVRDWIHVTDHCRALTEVISKGKPGLTYNIGGGEERRNIDVVETILRVMNKPERLISFVKDRPGHDYRYAVDFSRMENELRWKPRTDFEEGIEKTVHWYLTETDWVNGVVSREYLEYYDRMYRDRR